MRPGLQPRAVAGNLTDISGRDPCMRVDLVWLVLAYVLSQFFRAFLAVLAPVLATDIGATARDLSLASGLWFLTFALMQFPVGTALDRIGPRRTTAVLFALGAGGGAVLFALAQTPLHLILAMGLIGIGCSPVLMASYTIFAHRFQPQMFATLAAGIIGLGSLGNLAASVPLALAVEVWGWRATMAGTGLAVLLVALALARVVQDPPHDPTRPTGSIIEVLRIRALWPIFVVMFVCYAPAAALRGVWIGPYISDVHGGDTALIGQVTLIMGLAMVAGNFLYGPLDRWLGTRKWIIVGGNAGVVLACLVLWMTTDLGLGLATVLLAVIGLCGASFGLVVAHGRAFVPVHLTGRGVTMLNLFGIVGTALAQVTTGALFTANADPADPAAGFAPIFLYFGLTTLIGIGLYLFARDRTD
jgi:MFS family permease